MNYCVHAEVITVRIFAKLQLSTVALELGTPLSVACQVYASSASLLAFLKVRPDIRERERGRCQAHQMVKGR